MSNSCYASESQGMGTGMHAAGSRSPWVGLAAAVWIQLGSGSAYTFPLYSSSLKSVMGFSQQQVTVLGVANDIGENLGILPGIACNHFPPWMVLSCGVASCFLGYSILWLAITRTLLHLPYWLLWIALVIAANSNAWLGTTILVTNMRNFPRSRGTVAGILKGYTGVSAQIFSEIFSLVLKESAPNLLLFLTIGIPVICLTMMYFIQPCIPALEEDPYEDTHFLFTQGMAIFLGIYLLTVTLINDMFSLSQSLRYTIIAITVLLMLSPLAIPIKMTLFPNSTGKYPHQPIASSDHELVSGQDKLHLVQPLLKLSSSSSSSEKCLENGKEATGSSNLKELLALGKGVVKKRRRLRGGDDFEFQEALIEADFWLLWIVYFVGVGTGVTVVNNLAQIGYAKGVEDTTILLSLFSFGNFFGRLSGGAVSEYFVRTKTLPRTIWMTVTQLLMLITFLVYASPISDTLFPATLCIGTCFGVQYAVMIPTVSELFGLKNFGVLYNFMLIGNPLGALLFSGWLAGHVYDTEAAKQGGSTCSGSTCFNLTFLILSAVCGLGMLLSILLTIRIRPVYQMLYSGGSFCSPPSASSCR